MSENARVFHWGTIQKQLLWAYRGEVAPEFRKTTVTGYHVSLWYVIRGEAEVVVGDQLTRAVAGQWMMVPPNDHFQDFSEQTEILSFRFTLNAPSGRSLLQDDSVRILSPRNQQLRRVATRLVKVAERSFGKFRNGMPAASGSYVVHLELEAHFLLFLRELFRCFEDAGIALISLGETDLRLNQCIWNVQNSSLSRKWTEADLAQNCGLSVSQLNRLFHQQMGVTSRRWLQEYRLRQARTMLTTALPVKEVAYSLGFSSPQHFSTWFKKWEGISPAAFEKTRSAV